MSAEYILNNGEMTIRFEYTAPQQKAINLGNDCAHWLFDHGYGDHGTAEDPIYWEDLSNQAKLKILDKATKDFLISNAKSYHINAASVDAADAAKGEVDDRYEDTGLPI